MRWQINHQDGVPLPMQRAGAAKHLRSI